MHPTAIYGALPTAKGQVTDARAFIAPNTDLISRELGLHSLFRRPSLTTQLLGKSYHNYLGKEARPAIKNFQAKLAEISQKINDREASSPRPFMSGNPDQVIYQAWI